MLVDRMIHGLTGFILGIGFVRVATRIWNEKLQKKINDRDFRKLDGERQNNRTILVSSAKETRVLLQTFNAEGFVLYGFDPYGPSITLIKIRENASTLRLSLVPNGKALARSEKFRILWSNIGQTIIQSNSQTSDKISDMINKAAKEDNQ